MKVIIGRISSDFPSFSNKSFNWLGEKFKGRKSFVVLSLFWTLQLEFWETFTDWNEWFWDLKEVFFFIFEVIFNDVKQNDRTTSGGMSSTDNDCKMSQLTSYQPLWRNHFKALLKNFSTKAILRNTNKSVAQPKFITELKCFQYFKRLKRASECSTV